MFLLGDSGTYDDLRAATSIGIDPVPPSQARVTDVIDSEAFSQSTP